MRPALTPEEWATRKRPGGSSQHISNGEAERYDDGTVTYNNEYQVDDPHGLAALCLYGQPFGFTREDVRDLRNAADHHEWVDGAEAIRLHALADRIAALLPPETV